MPDSRTFSAPPSRTSSVAQLTTPAALIAISVTVAFLFMRVDELQKEIARLDQGRLTIARATAEALVSQSRSRGPPESREGTAPTRKHEEGAGRLEEESEDEEQDDDRVEEVPDPAPS